MPMDWVANLPPGYVYVLYVFLGRNGTLPVLPLEVQGNILLRWRNHERAEFNYNKAIIFFRKQFPEWPLTIIAEKLVEHKVELMSTPLKDLYWMYKKISSVSDPDNIAYLRSADGRVAKQKRVVAFLDERYGLRSSMHEVLLYTLNVHGEEIPQYAPWDGDNIWPTDEALMGLPELDVIPPQRDASPFTPPPPSPTYSPPNSP